MAAPATAQQVTCDSLLQELADPLAVTRYPDPPFLLIQSSSFDRASKSPADVEGWFANADAGHFLRVEDRQGRQESVMLDAEGPGAVVRIWSPNPKGTLRVYLDGATTPAIEAPMAALLDGTSLFGARNANEALAGERSRGWNLFVPITFAKRCVITTDDGKGVYYQINWRDYAEGVSIAPYDASAASRFAGFPQPSRDLFTRARPFPANVSPGESQVIAAFDEGAIIRSILVHAERPDLAVLVATFDGEQTVWIPLAELSRHATDLRGMVPPQGEAVGDVAGERPPTNFYVDWPMPFQSSAQFAILNLDEKQQRVSMIADAQAYVWDQRSMHFHATWKRDKKIHTRPFRDYRFVAIEGQGVLAGDSLHIVNTVDAWWGEGDEKIYVDGESFPSHFGTGTEDYYGYGWCCPEPFGHPLHSQTVCEGKAFGNNWGRTIVTRLRGLDSIPFTKKLVFDMELWHWAECFVNYSPCTFWYARPGATCDVASDPETAKLGWPRSPERPKPFAIQGALECESMPVYAMTPGLPVEHQGMKAYTAAVPEGGTPERGWSGDQHLWVKAKGLGSVIELAIPAEGSQPVRVTLYATKSWDYGIVQFSVNGRECGGPFDLFSGEAGRVVPSGPIDLGVHSGRSGRLILRVETVGKNAASLGSVAFFGLDCVTLGTP
jgi:Protein of unknown function (DUF2961)